MLHHETLFKIFCLPDSSSTHAHTPDLCPRPATLSVRFSASIAMVRICPGLHNFRIPAGSCAQNRVALWQSGHAGSLRRRGQARGCERSPAGHHRPPFPPPGLLGHLPPATQLGEAPPEESPASLSGGQGVAKVDPPTAVGQASQLHFFQPLNATYSFAKVQALFFIPWAFLRSFAFGFASFGFICFFSCHETILIEKYSTYWNKSSLRPFLIISIILFAKLQRTFFCNFFC